MIRRDFCCGVCASLLQILITDAKGLIACQGFDSSPTVISEEAFK